MTLLALFPIIFASFFVGATLGFGSTILAVGVGAIFYPLEELLPLMVVLNLFLSAYLVGRYRRSIDGRLLLRRVLPVMGMGLLVGMPLFQIIEGRALKMLFGVFVVGLSAAELIRMLPVKPGTEETTTQRSDQMRPLYRHLLLFAGGVIHGMYATGGPIAVYVAGRDLPDKGVFRSTLSALWLVLGLALLIGYGVGGQLTTDTAEVSAAMLLPVAVAITAGEWVHRRVNARLFRGLIFALLMGIGALLVATG